MPAWDPSVETWDVIDNGKMIGRFYLDMHPRPGKFSHAEMVPVLDGVRGKQCRKRRWSAISPRRRRLTLGLMEYGDVETFFHEFGHLMHRILGGQQQWAGISGITMEADFGEAPSQMLEELIRSPQVLAQFAQHYQTGEPIPAELVTRMNRAGAFGAPVIRLAQVSYTAISYDIYKGKPQDVDLDAVTDGTRSATRFQSAAGTHMYASFGHLGGYSSAYYTYMWDLGDRGRLFRAVRPRQSARGRCADALSAGGAGAGRIDVGQRPGEELPGASAEYDGVAEVDGGGICRRGRWGGVRGELISIVDCSWSVLLKIS